MRFTIGPWVYLVRICPGPLHDDEGAVAAITHERIILISGKVRAGDRLEHLVDQLRRLHVQHYGDMQPPAVATFTADVMRQLLKQGGEPALMRLGLDGVHDAGGAALVGAEPVGCECGRCGTKYAEHQITTAAAELDPRLVIMVVARCIECDFCGHLMSWTEGATPAGTPNGRVVSGPVYSNPHLRTS